VQLLRSSGIHHTLVITANDWGQGCDSILTDGTRLVMDDPDMNILFDMHIYNYLTVDGAHGGDATFVQNCMDRIKALNLPLLVGEFGHTHSEKPVQWQTVIARANANDQGYAPWLWYGDTEFEALNMNDTWEGPLSSWGDDLLPITGAKATIFQ
jgi:mannan endo-1,4-beta-mannosidase